MFKELSKFPKVWVLIIGFTLSWFFLSTTSIAIGKDYAIFVGSVISAVIAILIYQEIDKADKKNYNATKDYRSKYYWLGVFISLVLYWFCMIPALVRLVGWVEAPTV